MRWIIIFIFLGIPLTQALEIDEKLTLRIINTSESKKTILINRGIEDGIAKGDHAKFFVSDGVIARGVAIKLSPTRSVWSMYRLVNVAFLKEEQVMKLKITPAVKITKDESRMLVSDDTRVTPKDPRDIGIPLADGADDIDESSPAKAKMADSEIWSEAMSQSLLSRNKEVYSMIHYSGYSETTTPDNTSKKYSKDVVDLQFVLGGEWYFTNETQWYHRLSFIAVFEKSRKEVMAHLGAKVVNDSNDFGLGVNLNLFAYPSKVYTFIHYVNWTGYLGSSTSTYSSGAENSTAEFEDTVNASVIKYKFGYGIKYYTPSGFGMRIEASYEARSDAFEESELSSISYTRQSLGPIIRTGLSYRF